MRSGAGAEVEFHGDIFRFRTLEKNPREMTVGIRRRALFAARNAFGLEAEILRHVIDEQLHLVVGQTVGTIFHVVLVQTHVLFPLLS